MAGVALTPSSTPVKQEKDDYEDTASSPPAAACTPVSPPAKPPAPQPQPPAAAEPPKPPPIDSASICGLFGWTTVGGVHLPFILRGEGRYTSVRMVETKIIARYTRSLPWVTFACAKIKSYYITENEARLLNEINGFHCDYHFGKEPFTTKDVVVHLEDTVLFYEFIETCRTRLYPHDESPHFRERFGFLRAHGHGHLFPYLTKNGQKMIPEMAIPPELLSGQEAATRTVEWDLPYFRFLQYVEEGVPEVGLGCGLRPADDLARLVYLEEWWPSQPRMHPRPAPSEVFPPPPPLVRLSKPAYPSPIPATAVGPPPPLHRPNGEVIQKNVYLNALLSKSDPYATPFFDLLGGGGKDMIELCSPPPSPDPPFAVQLAAVGDKLLPCVNYLPHRTSQQLMVSLSDATARLFPAFPPHSLFHVLHNILGVRLYESSPLHQHMLTKQGGALCPANDWLIALADLKAFLPQLRYIVCKRLDPAKVDAPC